MVGSIRNFYGLSSPFESVIHFLFCFLIFLFYHFLHLNIGVYTNNNNNNNIKILAVDMCVPPRNTAGSRDYTNSAKFN